MPWKPNELIWAHISCYLLSIYELYSNVSYTRADTGPQSAREQITGSVAIVGIELMISEYRTNTNIYTTRPRGGQK